MKAASASEPLTTRVPSAWRRALRVLRTIIGEPDYERYVAHMRDHHPECAVPSQDEFMRQRMESRYTKPGSRCC